MVKTRHSFDTKQKQPPVFLSLGEKEADAPVENDNVRMFVILVIVVLL